MKRGSYLAVLAGVVALAVTAAATRPAEASFIADVTYTDGSIVSGPLSSDLAALPISVDATVLSRRGDGRH